MEKILEDVLEIGTLLGRRQAFSTVAGRCSAADAQSLRALRESKAYKSLGLTWEECCQQRLGIHRATAETIIRNLEEFGTDYFVIAQVAGISAKEYRRIQGSISNHALLHAGEEIPIRVENAERLASAVDLLRRTAADASTPSTGVPADAGRRLEKAERALRTALAELDTVRGMPLEVADRMR